MLAFPGGVGHGLFAHDMLAGLEGTDGVFGVHAVGEDDVDDVDIGVVFDGVEVVVVVDIFRIDVVLAGDVFGFVGVAGDEGDGFAEFAAGDAGEELALGEVADADKGEAEGFGRGSVGDGEVGKGGGGEEGGGGF